MNVNSEREALVQDESTEGLNEIENNGPEGGNGNGDGDSNSSSLGFWAVIFLTVNATLGAGMLNIPYAFHVSGGIVGSSVLHYIHLLLVILSLVILSHLCYKSSQGSFQSLTKHYCGSLIAVLTSIAIFVYSFGSSVTYLLIIRDQLDKVFGTFYPFSYNQYWYFNGDLILFLIAFLTILPLCCSKDISFLKYASFFGFLCTLYLTFLVFIEYLKLTKSQDNVSGALEGSLKTSEANNDAGSAGNFHDGNLNHWTSIFNVLPVLTFSYQCQLSWIPTFMQVRQPEKKKMLVGGMILVSMIICFASYTWAAVFGLLTFGPDGLDKDIMQNYDPHDGFVSTAMVLLILKTVVLFPVIMYVGRVVLEDLILPNPNSSSSIQPYNQTLIRIIVSTIWVLSASMLAIYVPNISVAIDYLGSLANLFVFILPGWILFRAVIFGFADPDNERYKSSVSAGYLWPAVMFVAYGTFVMVISVHQTLYPPQELSLQSLFFG